MIALTALNVKLIVGSLQWCIYNSILDYSVNQILETLLMKTLNPV